MIKRIPSVFSLKSLLPLVLLICFLLETTGSRATNVCNPNPTYCTPGGGTNFLGNGYVTEFKITDPLNNVLIDQTAAAQASCCAYVNNTGVGTPNLTPGVTYTISGSRQDDGAFFGTPDPFNYGMNIWIDYNDDGTFNNTTGNVEVVYKEGLSDIDAFSFTYTVPVSGITSGIHRLRIRTHYNDANPGPCTSYPSTDGSQAMDFLVNIVCTHTVSAIAGNDTSICSGAVVNLSSNSTAGNSPFSYSWCGPDSFASGQQNPMLMNVTSADSGTYYVIVTDSNGCVSTASMTVTINPSPTPGASNSGPVCSGGILALFSGGGASYAWTGPSSFSSGQQDPIITNVVAADSGIYTVTVTGGSGCTSSATTAVSVSQSSLAVTDSSSSPVCSGGALNLYSGGGTSYSWAGPNNFTSAQQSPVISNTVAADSGTYIVTVTGAGGCSSSASISVTVKPAPAAIDSSNNPVCLGSPLNLYSGGGAGYSWTGPNNFSSIQRTPVIANTVLADSGIYTVTITGASGCTTTASATINVNQLPSVTISSGSNPVCYGTELNLFSSGGASYSWIGPDFFTANQQDPFISNVELADSGTYTVTVTGSNGCTATDSIHVLIYAPMVAPVITQSGDSLTCSTDTSYISYQWYSSTALIPGATLPLLIVSASGNYNVLVTNNNGCDEAVGINVILTGIDQFTVDGLQFTISPNPAGNELTINSQLLAGKKITIGIYNMLGEKVYNGLPTANCQLPTAIDVSSLPAGIYFLQMKSESESILKRFVKE